jgi:inorganic triphosphatase YgiF
VGSAVTGHLETERKYDADLDFVLPDLGSVPGVASTTGPEVYQLSATYFDTDDLRLAAHRVTLRRRTGGTDEGWHLKLPVRPGTRRELHVPLSEGTDTVPPRLEAMVADITGGSPLRPVAVLGTRRTVRRLTGPGGEVLAEVADDEVTGRRVGRDDVGRDDALRWREIEVELVSGQPRLLDATDKLLREAGARPSASSSKLGRVLGTS